MSRTEEKMVAKALAYSGLCFWEPPRRAKTPVRHQTSMSKQPVIITDYAM